MRPNELTGNIIGAAIEVHRELGPGKLETAYELALSRELGSRGLPHEIQKPVPVIYKGVKLNCGYRLDLLVKNTVLIEVKSVEAVIPLHRAQVITYLRLGGWTLGLLLNFNVTVLKEGIERVVLRFAEAPPSGTIPSGSPLINASRRLTNHGLHSAEDSGDLEAERLAPQIIAAAIEVHRGLGPGLLASAYAACLCHEFHLRGLPFEQQRSLPLLYRGMPLGESDVVDLLVGGRVVVVARAVNENQPVHEAQVLSQLRLGRWNLGFLLNFNSLNLAGGMRRIVLSRAGRA
jgi:GxxExxY protein